MYRHVLFSAAALLMLTFSLSCKDPSALSQKDISKRDQGQFVSQGYASYRSSYLADVSYDLDLSFSNKETFNGTTDIAFSLKQPVDLTLDYNDGKVSSVTANGESIDVSYNGYFIELDAKHLQAGPNKITVEYTGNYATDGSGLYRFKDPEDGKLYHYTQFEPYDANQMFPCFDQPDLKATFAMQVRAPEDWTLISAQKESSRLLKDGAFHAWTFPTTKRFSTYIFSLHMGPYQELPIKNYKNIPLRLFARQSLAKFVKPEQWEAYTHHGFDFFQDYFDFPYPFTKYDQVIVPDFNFGAMENVGAVTFSERFVKRGEKTHRDRFRLANVIWHEMAHMWFGNLVTMKWWNDLWLNESFATFVAYVAGESYPEFPDTWKQFARTKQWAYREDARVTTHPIEAKIKTSEDAFANFDGITYGKGASSLQQISYLIGPDAFRDGVRSYFKKHAWKNTIRIDFTQSLSKKTTLSLDPWSKSWLQTAGTNTLEPELVCENGTIKSLKINQSSPKDYPTLRTHRNQVALLDSNLKVYKTIDALLEGPSTHITSATSQPCPSLVLLNANDKDFVHIALDQKSIAFLSKNISSLPSETVRSNLWSTLWNMVKNNQLSVETFVSMVQAHLPQEKDINVASLIAGTLSGSVLSATYLYPHATAPQKASRDQIFQNLNQNVFELLNQSKAGSDFQKLWFGTYISLATTKDDASKLQAWLDGKNLPSGFNLDQDKRWSLVAKLQELDHQAYASLLTQEKQKDPSSKGDEAFITSKALANDVDRKKEILSALKKTDWLNSTAKKRAAVKGAFPTSQLPLVTAMKDDLYKLILDVSKMPGEEVLLEEITRYATPLDCTQNSVNDMGAFIKKHKDLHPLGLKNLRIKHQEHEKCVAIKTSQNNPQ